MAAYGNQAYTKTKDRSLKMLLWFSHLHPKTSSADLGETLQVQRGTEMMNMLTKQFRTDLEVPVNDTDCWSCYLILLEARNIL